MENFKMNLGTADLHAQLDAHDVRYLSPAAEGRFGLPVGNGDLAAMVWTPPDRLQLTVNKSNTWDDAPELPVPDWHWSPQTEDKTTALVSCAAISIRNHLPMYDLTYLDDFEARLHLQQGYVSVDARSPLCQTHARVYVMRAPDVLVVDYHEIAGEAVEREIKLSRWGSRRFFHWYAQVTRDTSVGLAGTTAGCDGDDVWIEQKLRRISFAVVARFVGAGVHVDCPNSHTARITTQATRELRGQLVVAVVTSEEHADPLAEARRRVDEAAAATLDAMVEANTRRWADFWSRSFVRIPDAYVENLYYFSLYQLGACSLGEEALPCYGALWSWNHDARNWGAQYHWVTQQLMWPILAAGHPELGHWYYEWRYRSLPHARETARRVHGVDGAFYTDVSDRDGRQATNGALESHLNHNLSCGSQIAMDFWQCFLYTGDEAFLRDRAYSVMKASAQFYLACLEQDDEGVYHVPASTGYEGHLRVKDCVPDLAVIQQSFAACVEAATLLDVDADLRVQWQDVRENLAQFALLEENGQTVIATGIALEDEPGISHEVGRSYKKGEPLFYRGFWLPMAPAFPSGAVGLAQEGTQLFEALQNAVRIVGPTSAGGWIPSAVFAARLGMTAEALEWLKWYVGHCQTLPQGFMQEGQDDTASGSDDIWCTVVPWLARDGRRLEEKIELLARWFDVPAINCNANLMTMVQEMLLQSHAGIVRVFPSTPEAWGNAAFQLHAAGGFVVTAERVDGEPVYVHVESRRGGVFRMANPWQGRNVAVQGTDSGGTWIADGDTIEFATSAGAMYLLRRADRIHRPLPAVEWEAPVPGPRTAYGQRLGIPRYF